MKKREQKYYCDIEFAFIKKKSKKKLAQEALEWIGPGINEFNYTPHVIELDSDVNALHLHFMDESIGDLATFAEQMRATAKNCVEENIYPAENLKIKSIHLARSRGGIDLPIYFS